MKNKLLFVVIIILLPFAIFLGNKEIKDEENINKQNIIEVNLIKENETERLSFEDYLIGVVGQEMPASFNFEALKAQAVAARTFAYNYLENNEINIKDASQSYIDTNEMKEKWGNDYYKYYNKVKEAVLSTNNEVIKYNDNIIRAYYYAISNGKSEDDKFVFNEDLPYLTVVDSSFDENVKNFEVVTSFTYENFCALLGFNDCNINIENITRDSSNRILSIIINNKVYTGIEIRKILSLRSTDFSINLLENNIEVITKGYGHGVGMSQYGANYLANNGYNYKDILKY